MVGSPTPSTCSTPPLDRKVAAEATMSSCSAFWVCRIAARSSSVALRVVSMAVSTEALLERRCPPDGWSAGGPTGCGGARLVRTEAGVRAGPCARPIGVRPLNDPEPSLLKATAVSPGSGGRAGHRRRAPDAVQSQSPLPRGWGRHVDQPNHSLTQAYRTLVRGRGQVLVMAVVGQGRGQSPRSRSASSEIVPARRPRRSDCGEFTG